MPVEGDEFVNTFDLRSWVHDHTAWRERPFTDRVLAVAGGRFAGSWSPGRPSSWSSIPEARMIFTKTLGSADTDVVLHGSVSGFAGNGAEVTVAVGIRGGALNPAGMLWWNATYHAHISFRSRQTNLAAGQHTATLNVKGGWSHDHFDSWRIVATEVGKV